MKTPWQYAETGTEYAHQVALFMWCNMAAKFGITAANDPKSYSLTGYAIGWKNIKHDCVSDLEWLFAIKNAVGRNNPIAGARSAAEGVKAGVPDLCLPVSKWLGDHRASGEITYCGLYIEMKRPGAPRAENRGKKGVVSTAQIKWGDYLRQAGYAVEICYGWEAACDAILKYLGRV